jgi:2-dehydro-3-deoxyphosphogluconate aldolase/(4S)-4-hydroxy-2-oxoglutarate aldolase
MAKYSRIEVFLKMKETGVVPVYYNANSAKVKNVLKASYEGGIRVFEFLNRGDGAYEVFLEVIKYARLELPGLMLGAGSIVDAPTAAMYIQAGADLIVSPLLNPEIGKICNRRNILWVPGCATLSEINYAEELGAEICKIFPAGQVGGPEFVKNAKGPCPWINVMPTGGVEPNEDNLKKWFNAGVVCVGMGSLLFKAEYIENNDFESLKNKIIELVETINKLK